GRLYRNFSAGALEPLFRLEGGRGSPGLGLPSNLWPGRGRHTLLKQLWPLPISGEVDPIDGDAGTQERVLACLRGWAKRARLDPRRRSLPGAASGFRKG